MRRRRVGVICGDRDHDLLSLGTYERVTIVTPEALLTMLRRTE
jgi:hypothetical protein